MNNSLICEAHVKTFILNKIKSIRPGLKFTRVSQDALNKIEAKVHNLIVNAVKQHPSRGKTFTEIL
jgi:hypothetical protein